MKIEKIGYWRVSPKMAAIANIAANKQTTMEVAAIAATFQTIAKGDIDCIRTFVSDYGHDSVLYVRKALKRGIIDVEDIVVVFEELLECYSAFSIPPTSLVKKLEGEWEY